MFVTYRNENVNLCYFWECTYKKDDTIWDWQEQWSALRCPDRLEVWTFERHKEKWNTRIDFRYHG